MLSKVGDRWLDVYAFVEKFSNTVSAQNNFLAQSKIHEKVVICKFHKDGTIQPVVKKLLFW